MFFPLKDLLEELESAHRYEQDRITGHNELLSFPTPVLLSETGRAEVSEALAWSTRRLALLATAIQALQALVDDLYPDRRTQFALAEVIKELRLRLQLMGLAVAEFQESPVGNLTIGAEIDGA